MIAVTPDRPLRTPGGDAPVECRCPHCRRLHLMPERTAPPKAHARTGERMAVCRPCADDGLVLGRIET